MGGDLLHVVEAAQSLDVHDDAWMQGVTEAVGALLDRGHGAYGHTIDASDPQRLGVGRIFAYHGKNALVQVLRETNASIPPAIVDRTFRAGVAIATASQQVGVRRWDRIMASQPIGGIRDFACVTALDSRGIGCAVGAPLDTVQRYPTMAKQAWSRVAAHVVAMQRLRAVLSAGRLRPDGEAVLSPDARVEHAEGPAKDASAREVLREAVVARERARARVRRRDPHDALEMWQALVAGRWSIVDRFDRDGRRFLVAHENPVKTIGPRALSKREREVTTLAAMGHSNKLIAYELGLSPDSIGAYLQTAIRKLGLVSRVEVARVLRAAWMTAPRTRS